MGCDLSAQEGLYAYPAPRVASVVLHGKSNVKLSFINMLWIIICLLKYRENRAAVTVDS